MTNKLLALAMISKATPEEIGILERCFSSVASYVDKIYITLTYNEFTDEVKGYGEYLTKQWNAEVSYFKWVNDFSEARNFNFNQVSKDYKYILWLDSDDMLRGSNKLRKVLEENSEVDVFVLNYLYSFDKYKNADVVHLKTQIVRNDGCVKWVGKLHEDFKETRRISSYLIKGIDRLHLSEEKRFEEAKKRNLDIALDDVLENPNDPRSYWNLGNSNKALGHNKECINNFRKFLELSESDEEKYIVRMRIAEAYWIMGEREKGLDELRYAIGLRPNYPDAYFLMGNLNFELGNYDKAITSYLTGMKMKPPYYSIISYNPRDYDYNPMMNLSKVFFRINRPDLALPLLEGCLKIYPDDENTKNLVNEMKSQKNKFDKIVKLIKKLEAIDDKEKLRKELDKIPEEFKSVPQICKLRNEKFIKETSSGKDVVIFCAYTDEVWTPETAKTKGIGGSEEAVIWLSRLLTKRGWNVTVYNNCGHKELEFDGVKFKPFWSWNPRDKQDVTILWRGPYMLKYEINSSKIFIDLHDVIEPGEFTEDRLKKITKIFVKSKAHRNLFPNIPDDKFVIVSNGIDAELFKGEFEKDKYLLINTSSPDRSLDVLLDLFKEVKKEVPEAKLKWAYGWGVFDSAHGQNTKMMEWKQNILEKLKQDGVEDLGRISHGQVAELYKRAMIFAYPSEFFEIDCISLSKAQASGAIPVTTDFGAMEEKVSIGGVFINSEKNNDNWCLPGQTSFGITDENMKKIWVKEVIRILKNDIPKDRIDDMRKKAIERFDWNKVVDKWEQTFNE